MQAVTDYAGIPVIITTLFLGDVVPVRKYEARAWTTPARVSRIQKKWRKRYGTKIINDNVLWDGKHFLMSPRNAALLQASI